ncbi:hypothetical protein NADFUDRAFT_81037 [Nadsonia fulvescens var. elongata DSM 6958]|uniref:Uncharacterized protein n=1 Tax=Nadsonia fulvescens var. elongata DSM 6958 TaxID=857566 RepID=A0A1E3PR72_9ASCO|nr:hypothetical protein NADFUDRAFT_81037 [Nadsonia fulvescens var. elongata DSM 6958]
MQFKNLIAITALVASVSAKTNVTTSTNVTNGTHGNATSTPTGSEASAYNNVANIGLLGAVVAGGVALIL